MERRRPFFRSLISGLLVVTMTTVFSLAAYAEAPPDQDPGWMVVMGEVSVNGNPAKMGGTFYSGSTVTTGGNGIVIIELGVLGRASIGPSTTATITYSPTSLLVRTTCDDMRVHARQGQCIVRNIKNGETRTLVADANEHFDSNVEVTAGPFIDVVINCGRDVVCPTPIAIAPVSRFWLFGLLLLGGTGVVTSVIVKTSSPNPRLSETRPLG